jgi:hypothetical protein
MNDSLVYLEGFLGRQFSAGSTVLYPGGDREMVLGEVKKIIVRPTGVTVTVRPISRSTAPDASSGYQPPVTITRWENIYAI